MDPLTGQHLVGVEGTPPQIYGTIELVLKMKEKILYTKVVIEDNLTADIILDFLEQNWNIEN